MGIFYFPCNFVYWQKVKNHDKIKNILIPKVETLIKKHGDNKFDLYNASTNYHLMHERCFLTSEEDMIKNVVWDPIDSAINELNSRNNTPSISIRESFISDSWYTYYDSGGSFDYHNHTGLCVFKNGKRYYNSFSLIYILKDENDCNSTNFKETTHDHISTSLELETMFETCNIDDIKEGSVLIFPASLYHSVSNVKIPGRITIAINICSC
jgi:hypothetical protein